MTNTRATQINPDIVPNALLSRDQWVLWRSERRDDEWTKVPYQVTGNHASSTEPETWSSFETAQQYLEMLPHMDGIGYMFTAGSPIVGVDLDDCRDPETGEIDDWAFDVLMTLSSYTMLSTSGTGFHVYVLGSLPGGGNRKGNLEMYDKERFFAFTGDRAESLPTDIEQRNDELREVWDKYIDTDDDDDEDEGEDVHSDEDVHLDLDDEELIEKASAAANGDYFRDLYNGDWQLHTHRWSGVDGEASQSEADQAFCNLLAWWTGHDETQMRRIFETSGLHREKWDTHSSYADRTITAACRKVTGQYTPPQREDPEEEFGDIDTDAFERKSTASMRVFSAAMKFATVDDLTLDDRFHPVGEREVHDEVSDAVVDVLEAVALEEGLVDGPDERVEGRVEWIKLGHAMRWRGADVPEYDPGGGARVNADHPSKGW